MKHDTGRITPMLQALEALVRCESPSDDLNACKKVISLANEIATKELGKPAEILEVNGDRKSTRLNSSHIPLSRMPSSA